MNLVLRFKNSGSKNIFSLKNLFNNQGKKYTIVWTQGKILKNNKNSGKTKREVKYKSDVYPSIPLFHYFNILLWYYIKLLH